MPAPPITPSPHRFVLTQDTRGRPPFHSQQFKSTPRFSFSSSIRHQQSHYSSPLITQQRTKPNDREDIDSASSETSSVKNTDEDDEDDIPLPNHGNEEQQEGAQDLPSRPPKRPRHYYYLTSHEHDGTNNNDDPIPSSSPSAPRFHNVEPLSTGPTAHHQHPSIKPPTPFILPPEPLRAHSPPLSLLFSPHRTSRHHSSRFVPGGLASEVREWVIHTISASSTPAQGQGQYVLRVKVKEIKSWEAGGGGGGCFVLASRLGRDLDGEGKTVGKEEVEREMRMLLVGGNGAGGGQQRKRALDQGDILGLRQPIWDIILQGERWSVGVDWSIF